MSKIFKATVVAVAMAVMAAPALRAAAGPGVGEAPLGLPAASPTQSLQYDLCYQPSGGGTLQNFTGGGYSIGQITPTRATFTAAASVTPGAGTWNVGFCAINLGANQINNNDFTNGWVMVTN